MISVGCISISARRSIPNIHILHAHDDIVIVVEECTVKGHDVIRVTSMHDLQFSHDSLPHFLLSFDVYDLMGSRSVSYPTHTP